MNSFKKGFNTNLIEKKSVRTTRNILNPSFASEIRYESWKRNKTKYFINFSIALLWLN